MRCADLNNGVIRETDETPLFDYTADVLVVGLGTAGAIAAIVAAEKGLNVIGIDRLNGMGGIGTFGCVWDYYFGSPGGRFEGIDDECRKMLKNGYVESDYSHQDRSYPCSVKSYVLEKNALKAGCCLWFKTVPTGVYLEGNKVVGVRCLNKGKTLTVKTSVVIDCTGDSGFCRMAGCGIHTGRESDGISQQFSKAVGIIKNGYVRGVWSHCGRIEKYDAKSISDAIIKAGSEAPCLKMLHTENDRIIYEGAILGIRESHRIEAEEVLSFKEYIIGKRYKQPVFYAFSQVDNVNRDIAFESEALQDWYMMSTLYNYGISVGIPMGTLIPKGIDGILAAGKGVGADHDFASCIRMKKDIEKCGEAAAIMAFIAVSRNIQVKDVPYEHLKQLLEESGCLDQANDVGMADLRYKEGNHWRKIELMTEPEDIRTTFASEYSGIAMWSVKQLGAETMIPYLRLWMNSGNVILANNSTIAAGMLGDPQACTPLRKLLSEQPYIPENHPQRPYYADYTRVICLLGRLCDKGSTELLLNLIESRAADAVSVLETDSYYTTLDDYAFQFISMALVSLIRIAEAHPDVHDMIAFRLKKWAADDSFSIVNTMGKCEMGSLLHNVVFKSFGK